MNRGRPETAAPVLFSLRNPAFLTSANRPADGKKTGMWRSRLPDTISLDLSDRTVEIALRVNPRARRFILRHGVDGTIALTLPPGGSLRDARRFVETHKGWVESNFRNAPEARPFVPGARVPFRGEEHVIVHRPDRRGTVRLATAEGEPALEVSGGEPHLARRLTDWMKRSARETLVERVETHAAELGVKPGRIRIGDTTSRWGSCSSTGSLSFSWRIVLAPPEVLDYLAAHEVAHLAELNHSARFWRLVARLDPDYEANRAWLRSNGPGLHAVGGG